MSTKVSRETVALRASAVRDWAELTGDESPVRLLRLSTGWLLFGEPAGRGEVHASIATGDPVLTACELVARWARSGTLARAGWRLPLTSRADLVERLVKRRAGGDLEAGYVRVIAELDVQRALREGISPDLSADLLEVMAGGSIAGLEVLAVVELLHNVALEFAP